MVNQSAGAAVGSCRQQGQSPQTGLGLEALGLQRLHIVHHHAGLLQGPLDLRLHWRELELRLPEAALGGSLQRLGQGGGALALVAGEVAIAGAHGQAIGLAQGGATPDLNRQAQILDDALEDLQLLPVLLAQQQNLGADQGQQAYDDRGHPIEMSGSVSAAESRLQRRPRLYAGEFTLPLGIDLFHTGCEKGVGSGLLGDLQISF